MPPALPGTTHLSCSYVNIQDCKSFDVVTEWSQTPWITVNTHPMIAVNRSNSAGTPVGHWLRDDETD